MTPALHGNKYYDRKNKYYDRKSCRCDRKNGDYTCKNALST